MLKTVTARVYENGKWGLPTSDTLGANYENGVSELVIEIPAAYHAYDCYLEFKKPSGACLSTEKLTATQDANMIWVIRITISNTIVDEPGEYLVDFVGRSGDDVVKTNKQLILNVSRNVNAAEYLEDYKIDFITSTEQRLKALEDAGDVDVSATDVGLGNVTNESKATMFNNPTFTGTVVGVTKTHVGLPNADNTSDADKPVSTATQTALDLKADKTNTIKGVYEITNLIANTTYNLAKLGDVVTTTVSSSYNKSKSIAVVAGDTIVIVGGTYGTSTLLLLTNSSNVVTYILRNSLYTKTTVNVLEDGYALISAYDIYEFSVVHYGKQMAMQKEFSEAIYAPSPQLPANTDATSDFDSDTCQSQDIYDYIDALVEEYPHYLSKEIMGLDESGTLNCVRYIANNHYYIAWMKNNYPKMYAFKNGTTTLYFLSCSPRIGDIAYTVPYIGTYDYAVTAISNANQTVTVNSIVYTRTVSENVRPTVYYSSILSSSLLNEAMQPSGWTISTIVGDQMTDSAGNTYTRYPIADDNAYYKPKLTIVLYGNEHGPTSDPRECAIVLARLLKDLCNVGKSNIGFLKFIKNNVKLVVIPVVNPYGFDVGQRNNYNNVNINRNYDCIGWSVPADTDKGSYGGSENETQYVMNTIKASNANVALSLHCLAYGLSANDEIMQIVGTRKSLTKVTKIMEAVLSEYNFYASHSGVISYTTNAQSSSYFDQNGVYGGLLEFNARQGKIADLDTALHTPLVLEADYTFLLQTLYMFISDYSWRAY